MPSVDEVVLANVRVCASTGGLIGIDRKGRELLAKILAEVSRFSGSAQAAAHFMCRVAQDQPFVDGNKRTAFAVAEAMLEKEGQQLEVPAEEIKRFLPLLKEGGVGERDALAWLKKHFRKG